MNNTNKNDIKIAYLALQSSILLHIEDMMCASVANNSLLSRAKQDADITNIHYRSLEELNETMLKCTEEKEDV